MKCVERAVKAGPGVLIPALLATVWMAMPGGAGAAARSAPTTTDRLRQAFALAYNLDHEAAMTAMQAVVAEAPSDPAPHRALATVTWLNLLFKRGLVLVEHYLGPVSRSDVKLPPPPAETARMFQQHVTTAISLAEAGVARAPNDPAALYQLGTAVGLQASWAATIEGRVLGAFGSARRAYNAHERVLALAPTRKDAGPDRRHLPLSGRQPGACRRAGSPTWPASAATRSEGSG